MSERVMPARTDGLITLVAADALWVDLTAASAVPTASGAFTCSPARARVGYVLLGGHVVATGRASGGQWSVAEVEVRRAAAELNAVGMDRQDLVRVGPFRGAPRQECNKETPLRWRQRITGELQEPGGPERAARREVGRPYHLAGIDWRQILVEQTRDGTQRTWWLPRAAVRLLDAAEHAETQWVQAAQTCQASAAVTEPPSHPRQAQDAGGRQTTSPEGNFVRLGRPGYTYVMQMMQENARALADNLRTSGRFEVIGSDLDQLPLVAFRLAGKHAYDESDVAWQLSAERGWMVPAYTLPPNAERVKILRALVKETPSREQIDRLTQDIADACGTLDRKGATTDVERAQVKRGTGY
ncbi:hypothetical protein [Streptomyces sp. NPDC058206]|uniref:hypothetical protein n=1 Tax=Streptomyces sp. NPDC058206 TaxID=3346382 RepID=UPI0036DFCF27